MNLETEVVEIEREEETMLQEERDLEIKMSLSFKRLAKKLASQVIEQKQSVVIGKVLIILNEELFIKPLQNWTVLTLRALTMMVCEEFAWFICPKIQMN